MPHPLAPELHESARGGEGMTDAVNAAKLFAGTLAAVGAIPGAVDAVQNAERLILGAPQSVLFVAFTGTLIGVLLLPEKETDRITPDDHLEGRWPRALQMAKRIAALALFVVSYTFVAAWIVVLAAHWFPSLTGAPQLPLAGISGVLIRRMLPNYLRVAERVTGAVGGKPQ